MWLVYSYSIETTQQETKMNNLIGKKFYLVDVWTSEIVDVFAELTVVQQNEKAVRFDDGSTAYIDGAGIVSHVAI